MYAMLGPEGPSISADGLHATVDLTSPATANQPQLSNQYQASQAAAQEGAASSLDLQGRLDPLLVATPTPEGVTSSLAPAPTATSTMVPDCVPSSSGLYCVYTVKAGDTLSVIAQRFGITGSGELSSAEILALSNRPAVIETNSIETGLKLRIPSETGIIHSVFSNETLSDIARIYGVDAVDIRAANAIGGSGILAGQNLLVPDPQYQRLPAAAAAAAPTATPEPAVEEEETADTTEADEPGEGAEEEAALADTEEETALPPPPEPAAPEASATPAPPTATATATPRRATATPTAKPSGQQPSSAGFIWPAAGPISSYFGPSHPLGIDIDFYANPNQAVGAVAAGTVTFAGGDPCCSYGYYVIVDHGNGFQTLYAHFSRFASGITAGTKVSQGQTLGYGGRTGYATGEHLHFEVHLNGAIVNPLSYLP